MGVFGRLFEEHSQLGLRLEKLENFVFSDKFNDLPEIDRAYLKTQLKYMKGYFNVLNHRLSRHMYTVMEN